MTACIKPGPDQARPNPGVGGKLNAQLHPTPSSKAKQQSLGMGKEERVF